MSSDSDTLPDLTEEEEEAIHEVELALESLRQAHGHLVAFHHAVGHGMDHLDEAEAALRECDRADLADRLRGDLLPRGVLGDGTWTYDVVEQFEDGFMSDIVAFEERARDEITDGRRHVAERRMQTRWRERADED